MTMNNAKNKSFIEHAPKQLVERTLVEIANHYNTDLEAIKAELLDDDAELVYEYMTSNLRLDVYEYMQAS